MRKIRSVCVYCGSSPGNDPVYIRAGIALGHLLAEAGLELVYGGGTKGIMGAVAQGVLEKGGHITGIIPHFLISKEASEAERHRFTEFIVTENMHQRKHLMFERADALITLPGGLGTVDEIIEMMTWAQLGHHAKPMVFADINGFWQPILALFRHMEAAGFLHDTKQVRPLFINRVEDIVPAIFRAAPDDDALPDNHITGRL